MRETMTTRKIERTPTPTTDLSSSTLALEPTPVDKSLTPIAQPSPEAQQRTQPEDFKMPSTPRRKIDIQRTQLAYGTVEIAPMPDVSVTEREVDPTTHVVAFPFSAPYTELVGHCEQEHGAVLEALACMSPGEVAEMRQRFQASQ